MEIDVFSKGVMLNYIRISLYLLLTSFDFLVDNLILKIQRRLLKFLINIYLKKDQSTLLNNYLFGMFYLNIFSPRVMKRIFLKC